jgi:hypothetical protein
MGELMETESKLNLDQYIEQNEGLTGDNETAFRHYLYNIHEHNAEHERDDWESHEQDFIHCYCGYGSFIDFVEEFFAECNEIPKYLERYIDYKAIANDWETGGDYWVVEDTNGNDFIFRAC